MNKVLTTLAAAAIAATAALAAPAPANAGKGGAVALGIVGGLAAGAIIAGAANPYGYGYYGGPAYYGGGPAYYGAYGPGCVIQRERVWNGYRWVSRRVRVCY